MKKWMLLLTLFAMACSDGTVEWEPGLGYEDGALDEAEYDTPEGATGPPVFAVDVSKWAAEITDEEYACMYDHGVRHVIVGTQNYRVAKQQIEEALEAGMSLDAYVYLYWDFDWSERVQQDLEFLQDYPVGRFWLDVEDHPGGYGISAMESKIQEGLDACGEMPCGIYTAGWWWKPHMRNSDTFKDIPLWHAYYDLSPSLKTWDRQKFGGWEIPWGKQYNETYLCGVHLDVNTMFIDAEPVAPPKSFDPVDELTAPADLYPHSLLEIRRDFVKALADAVPGADRYQIEVEHYSNGRWFGYFTFWSDVAALEFTPNMRNRAYRFRMRAQRDGEFGPWSRHAHFQYFAARELPELPDDEELGPAPEDEPDTTTDPEPEPETEPEPDPQPEPEPDPEPEPAAGTPTNLLPADGSQLPNGYVTLSCDEITGATEYAFEIQFWHETAQEWRGYYTYRDDGPQRRFYPQANKAYRWRVIATTTNEEASGWSTFAVGSATL